MNSVLVIFIFLLVLQLGVRLFLDLINLRYVRSKSDEVPSSFSKFIDLPAYKKSIAYTLARTRFSMASSLYDSLLLAAIILLGVLPWMYVGLSSILGFGVWGQALVLFLITVALGVTNLPFEWWSTFVLEERFGFNKSTQGLWWIDKLKGLLLGFVIGYPLLTVLIFLVDRAGDLWWVWAFVVFFLFQLIMVVAYPMLIMPLFNKMEPLEEGELKDRLFSLAERTGFKAKSILVIDGSKRSKHSNAFFAGFGKFRQIVLYDTLIEQMDHEELEAVLAHEIGHYKKGHIPQRIALSALMLLGTFALLGWLASGIWFAESFCFSAEAAVQFVPVLLLFILLKDLLTFWLSPLNSFWSRMHEYEADAFARDAMHSENPLISALRKLHRENLSNLTPHPVYSRFYYSHPTLLEREYALSQK